MSEFNQSHDTQSMPQGEQSVGNAQPQNEVNAGAIRKSTTAAILKAASVASGVEFDSVETLAATLARLSAQQTAVAPTQPTRSEETSQNRVRTSDLAEQFQSLRSELQSKEQALRERELDAEIRSAMGDKFDSDLVDYALSKVRSNITWEDGSYAIVNTRGQIRYGEDGAPLTISSLVAEVAKSNPKLLRQSGNAAQTGSGLRGNNGMFGGGPEKMPDYATDPAGFSAWAARNGIGKNNGLKGMGISVRKFGDQ
jgi:hypothetical protein